jgi:hypothetical protein
VGAGTDGVGFLFDAGVLLGAGDGVNGHENCCDSIELTGSIVGTAWIGVTIGVWCGRSIFQGIRHNQNLQDLALHYIR